jgi:hypothetical protein
VAGGSHALTGTVRLRSTGTVDPRRALGAVLLRSGCGPVEVLALSAHEAPPGPDAGYRSTESGLDRSRLPIVSIGRPPMLNCT